MRIIGEVISHRDEVTGEVEFKTPSIYMQEVIDRIEKTNRKPLRYGLEAIKILSQEERTVTETKVLFNVFGQKEEVKVTTEYTYLKLKMFDFPNQGYSLLGVIDFQAGGTILLAPGITEKEEWKRVTATRCDHCNIAHVRNKVIIVQKDDTGEVFFVGSSCIEEYLGISVTPHLLLISLSTEIRELEDEFRGTYSQDHGVSITDILCGYAMNSYTYDREAVRNLVGYCSSNRQYMPDDMKRKISHLQKELKDLSEKVDNYMQEKYSYDKIDTFSGFERNFAIAYHSRHFRTLNILIGGICNVAKKIMLKPANNTVESSHIGTVGGHFQAQVTLKSIHPYETQWGAGNMHIFNDEKGNVLVWYTSSSTGFNEGDSALVKGKVKKHSEFRGIKQTQITHVKRV